MNKARFKQLEESVRDGGRILRGEIAPSRAYIVEAHGARRNPETHFAICIETDDPELMIVGKIYQVTLLTEARLSVRDEAGETALYPVENFVIVSFPPPIEKLLQQTIL